MIGRFVMQSGLTAARRLGQCHLPRHEHSVRTMIVNLALAYDDGWEYHLSHLIHVRMMMLRVLLAELMNREDVLFGVPKGRQCLTRLLEQTMEPLEPSVVFLDFSGVASATVSFLREGPLAYRQHVRGRSSTLYPVFANLAPSVADSLGEYLTASRDAVYGCDLTARDQVTNPRLIGQLEPKQRLTFDAVEASEGVTAAELARQVGEEIQITAWNNRLSALVQKGLIFETSEGRRKVYRSIFTKEII